MFIRHPEQQLKRCHFEPQLKGHVPSHNLRNTTKPTFEISPKPCRARTSRRINHFCLTKIIWRCTRIVRRNKPFDRLTGDAYRQAPSASILTTSTTLAWRDFLCCQASRVQAALCISRYRLAVRILPPNAVSVIAQCEI